jgi:hypothetical protein
LTEQQLELLRWIDAGCPAGVVDGTSYRISVRALQRRDLVRVSGSGDGWRARITKEGRAYLRSVDGDDPPVPRQANGSVTQRLVDDVVAAGGVLRVSRRRWNQPGSVDYAGRARLAELHRKVPAGKRLTVAVSGDELEISLVEAPGRPGPELVPVPVPQRVGRYHEAARVFRQRSECHEVSRALLPRTCLLVHAIAVEAEQRGWGAAAPDPTPNRYGYVRWTGTKHGHLAISASGYEFRLRIQEDGVCTRGPWEEAATRYRNVRRDIWPYEGRDLPTGPYDGNATGRLKLELFAEGYWLSRGRQSRWADGKRWTVEERLPHLFREIEERIADALQAAQDKRIAGEGAAEAARREAEERERQWNLLMEQARERLVVASRATRLRAELGAWQEADAIHRYCDAIEERHCGEDPSEWVAWCRSYAERLDPLSDPPLMPIPPDPTPEALQPHLPTGWSAHGPHHGHSPQPPWAGVGYRR